MRLLAVEFVSLCTMMYYLCILLLLSAFYSAEVHFSSVTYKIVTVPSFFYVFIRSIDV